MSALRLRSEAISEAASSAREAAEIWSSLTDRQRQTVSARRRLVDEWRAACRRARDCGETSGHATAIFLEIHSELSQNTLYRWHRLRDDPDPSALIDMRGREKAPRSRAIGEAAWSHFLATLMTRGKRSVALCHGIARHEAGLHAGDPAWSWPSLRYVQMRVKRDIPKTQIDFYQLGDREWAREHMPSIPRDYSQYRSGEWWVGDFHQFDVFCRRSETDPTIVRPLLGGFLDLRSCMLLGVYIGESENSDAVMLCLADGIRKYGAPWQVTIDNGKPYRSQGVSGGRPKSRRLIDDEQLFRDQLAALPSLHIGVHFSIPWRPNSKRIERFFRTVECQFGARFDSYCGGQMDSRFQAAWKLAHDHPEQCPTIEQVREKFAAWLEEYHHTAHGGEGMEGLSPTEAFAKFDPIPRSVCPPDLLEFLVMRVYNPRTKTAGGERHGVVVTKDGVRYRGIQYGSTDPRMWDLHGQRLPLRVHPEDASFVIVCDEQGKPLIRCQNNRAALAGLTREDVGEGIRAQKRAARYAREIRKGALQPMIQSTIDASIAARASQAQSAMDRLMAATGTDDRNIAPLATEMREPFEQFQKRIAQPPANDPSPSLRDLADAIHQRSATPAEDAPAVDIVSLFSGDGGAA